MEKKFTSQENVPKTSLEERRRDFIEGMQKEIGKDAHLKGLNPTELPELFFLMYEKAKAEKLTQKEFFELKAKAENFMGWIGGRVHGIQSKAKNNS